MKKAMVFVLVIILTLALSSPSFAGNFGKPGGTKVNIDQYQQQHLAQGQFGNGLNAQSYDTKANESYRLQNGKCGPPVLAFGGTSAEICGKQFSLGPQFQGMTYGSTNGASSYVGGSNHR